MTKTRSELWRKEREDLARHALHGSTLLLDVNFQLEQLRATMHESLDLPPPAMYATSSVENTRLLCRDLRTLTIALALRAKGLTCEADETLAEAAVLEIEEETSGNVPHPRGH